MAGRCLQYEWLKEQVKMPWGCPASREPIDLCECFICVTLEVGDRCDTGCLQCALEEKFQRKGAINGN